jgi:hypothetical protein
VYNFADLALLDRRLAGGGFFWQPSVDLRNLTVATVREAMIEQLKPLGAACRFFFSGETDFSAFSAPGAPPPLAADLSALRAAATYMRGRLAQATAALATHAAAPAPPEALSAAPCVAVLRGEVTCIELYLQCFADSMREHALRNAPEPPTDEWDDPTEAAAPAAPPPAITPAAALQRGSLYRGFCAATEYALRAQALCADAKLGSFAAFCQVEATALVAVQKFTTTAAEAFEKRVAWTAALLGDSGGEEGASVLAGRLFHVSPSLLPQPTDDCPITTYMSAMASSVKQRP